MLILLAPNPDASFESMGPASNGPWTLSRTISCLRVRALKQQRCALCPDLIFILLFSTHRDIEHQLLVYKLLLFDTPINSVAYSRLQQSICLLLLLRPCKCPVNRPPQRSLPNELAQSSRAQFNP